MRLIPSTFNLCPQLLLILMDRYEICFVMKTDEIDQSEILPIGESLQHTKGIS